MNKTNKLLSIILVIACIFSTSLIGTTGVTAEDTAEKSTKTTNYGEIFNDAIADYYFYGEFMNGFFEEGSSPPADAIDYFIQGDVMSDFDKYRVEGEDDYFYYYEIPADKYEALVFRYFGKTDAVIEELHSSNLYKTDKDAPYYYIVIGGGFGGPLPSYEFQGYRMSGDGFFETWAYLAQSVEEIWNEETQEYEYKDYTPSETDVEGVDYIYIQSYVYDYDEVTETLKSGYTYCPAKIVGAVSSLVTYDSDNVMMYSYEKTDADSMPASDELILIGTKKETVYVGDAYMDVDINTFELGTEVKGYEITEGEIYDKATTALENVTENFAVYEFNATKDGAAVQPKEDITVTFDIPYGLSTNIEIYYIAEDGTAEKLDTVIDFENRTATAVLSHFSTYVLADIPFTYGDADDQEGISISDVSAILKYIADWDITITAAAADVNCDGKISITDATLILNYIAKWDGIVLGPVSV